MKHLSIIILLLAASLLPLHAQVQIGVGGGGNYNFHSSPDIPESLSVEGFGPFVSLQLDKQFSRCLGLLVWADVYNDASATWKEEGLDYKFRISYLSIAPTLKFCFPGSPFYLYGGPGVGFKTTGKVRASYEGVSAEESVPGMQMRLDVRFGFGYDFFLTRKVTLSPFAGFNIGLNGVATDGDWKINTLSAGLILRYNLF